MDMEKIYRIKRDNYLDKRIYTYNGIRQKAWQYARYKARKFGAYDNVEIVTYDLVESETETLDEFLAVPSTEAHVFYTTNGGKKFQVGYVSKSYEEARKQFIVDAAKYFNVEGATLTVSHMGTIPIAK